MRCAALLIVATCAAAAQSPDEDFHVYRDSPRLLLTAQRQRLLERERERQSSRWQVLDGLIASGAALPEPGFALALHYKISRESGSGRKAIEWALTNDDLRQIALVYDWCLPLLSGTEGDRIATKIQEAIARPASTMSGQSARALAAIAIAERLPDAADGVLREVVAWWRKQPVQRREDLYPLFEFLHAIRDNTKIDLREASRDYFADLPLEYVASFYPAAFPGPENDFRIPVFTGTGEPDVNRAAMARAGGLAMVALDTNAVNYQFAQGMLMNDRFVMRGDRGAPYEFVWANPYQPGLAYQTLPLVFHSPSLGSVFARTSWEEDATWIGYFEGNLQLFRDGGVQAVRAGVPIAPVRVGSAILTRPTDPAAVRVQMDAGKLFVLGLKPNSEYGVEIDDQELELRSSDVGGTLVVEAAEETEAGVLIRPHGVN